MDKKKTDKRLCWNCEGEVSLHFSQCPYCGADLLHPSTQSDENVSYSHLASPFQTLSTVEGTIPSPPYGEHYAKDIAVTDEEWKKTLEEKKEESELPAVDKQEMGALLLLLPGIVLALFGLILIFFSKDGILTLHWNQNLAFFYLLGSVPLLYLGWRAFR